MKKRIDTKRERVDVTLLFADGTKLSDKGTLTTRTEWHLAGSEQIEGLKETVVDLSKAVPFDKIGETGDLTLSNGDTWRAWSTNGTRLVRSGA